MISLFWLVIHAHGIKGHGQVDIFTIKQTLLDEVNAGKILPNPTLKLNHSSQNFWIWMLFLSFSFLHTKIQAPDFLQNQLAFRFQTRTFMSLPSEPLMMLPAFTTGSGQLSQLFSELSRLNGTTQQPLNVS